MNASPQMRLASGSAWRRAVRPSRRSRDSIALLVAERTPDHVRSIRPRFDLGGSLMLVLFAEWSTNHAAALGRFDVAIASSIPYRQYQTTPKAGPQAPRAKDIGRMILGASHLTQSGRDVRLETCCPRPKEMVSMTVRAVLGSSFFCVCVSLPCVHGRRAVICDHV